MTSELDVFGRIVEIEIDESAAIAVEQVDDEITVVIASVVGSFSGHDGSGAQALPRLGCGRG